MNFTKKIFDFVSRLRLGSLLRASAVVLLSLIVVYGVVKAGDLTAPEGEPSSNFYTLSDIYSLIVDNTTAEEGDHSFGFSDALEATHYTLTQIYDSLANLISADKVKSGTTYLAVEGTLTPSSGASSELTAANAVCGTTYFGVDSDSWTVSEGTGCDVCQECSDGSCVNLTDDTKDEIDELSIGATCDQACKKCSGGDCVYQSTDEDVFSDCGGNSCCGYCDGEGGCSYVESGLTCSSPGDSCGSGNACDGAGVCAEWACNQPITYSGQEYDTVLIGTQCWTAENLNIGTRIDGADNQTDNDVIEKYCYLDDTNNCDTYGGLYQWDEVMAYSEVAGSQGICPSGWHIPTHDEWTTLERAVCDSDTCETDFPYDVIAEGWRGTNEGTSLKTIGEPGFKALLGGYRSTVGSFANVGSNSYLWSSSVSGADAWRRNLSTSNSDVYRKTNSLMYGFSARCLKD